GGAGAGEHHRRRGPAAGPGPGTGAGPAGPGSGCDGRTRPTAAGGSRREDRRVHREGCELMRVAVAGATGMLGAALVEELRSGGDEVVRLIRGGTDGDGVLGWDPSYGKIRPGALRGF